MSAPLNNGKAVWLTIVLSMLAAWLVMLFSYMQPAM